MNELFAHQRESIEFIEKCPTVYDMSDAGTGKTRVHLEAFARRRRNGGGRCLVLCPKSIMRPAWGNDIKKFAPDMTWSCAIAGKREEAFHLNTDFVIMNHDGVKDIVKRDWKRLLSNFDTLIVDESTAFKHRTSARSKALCIISKHFEYRALLTGTPMTNSVLELWHQALVLDGGERLGNRFWNFRNAVCEPVQVGRGANMIDWRDKPGAATAVSDLLSDITIRHKLEECLDMPEHAMHTIEIELSDAHRAIYDAMLREALLQFDSGEVTAMNAAIHLQKLMQIASGAVYTNNQIDQLIDTDRYELVIELIEQRKQCLVAFNWAHQKRHLTDLAARADISFGVIDGMTPQTERERLVDLFQEGHIKVIFAHPQTAAHGLTLTAGTTTIWCSPTYNAEHYLQFNKRIYRAGQTKRTETLNICAINTVDEAVYQRLNGKLQGLDELLDFVKAQYQAL